MSAELVSEPSAPVEVAKPVGVLAQLLRRPLAVIGIVLIVVTVVGAQRTAHGAAGAGPDP